ncbi:MAG: DnaJ domain-containing protein [Gammaproteobacteria bacterium]|nr:DnaJ domain-containing protein [Gammaproteobacteria bacterium]
MAFTDYYAALNLSRNATDKEIKDAFLQAFRDDVPAERFRRATEAQVILANPKKRAEYDKNLGYVMVVQAIKSPYLSGLAFELTNPERAHAKLLKIVEDYKSFVENRAQTTWDDAQSENYGYELIADEALPYVALQFVHEADLGKFVNKLKAERVIKA